MRAEFPVFISIFYCFKTIVSVEPRKSISFRRRYGQKPLVHLAGTVYPCDSIFILLFFFSSVLNYSIASLIVATARYSRLSHGPSFIVAVLNFVQLNLPQHLGAYGTVLIDHFGRCFMTECWSVIKLDRFR